MEIYSQKDPRWADKMLGSSDCSMKNFGCLVTDVAQALTLAGYSVTPGDLVDNLSANGGFDENGLLQWEVIGRLYPQFNFDSEVSNYINTTFVKGSWGLFKHWLLEVNGVTYEPYYGKTGVPANFDELSRNRIAAIEPYVAPTPEPTPEPTPAPTPEPAPQPDPTPAVFEYTVVSGDNLTNICHNHYGLDKNSGDAYRKALQVAAYNGIADPNLINVGQVIKLP